MNFFQALRYFVREAWLGLARSWRVSLLAIFTIGVSLFLAGAFLLTSGNLARSITTWRQDARFVVYLNTQSDASDRAAIENLLQQSPWVEELVFVSPDEGAERFRTAFPTLAELVEDDRYGSLPATFEARLVPNAEIDRQQFRDWASSISASPAVETVDDDREWIEDVETLLAVVRTVGTILTGVLLGAAVFTIAAVVRLTSFLYRDEIAIMRLVGATEFFIRGPFYLEGILQGVLGAAAALGALQAAHLALLPRLSQSLVLSVAARDFLPLAEVGALLAFGAAAGLGGALVSLGREQPTSERS
jgi:cell division transport system permease protein